jgi:hypothetical protein
MPRGGARPNAGGWRPGAGRPKGSRAPQKKTCKTNALALQAAAAGVLPLEVLLRAMRQAWAAGDLDQACVYAAQAAPYCHPKIAPVRAAQEAPEHGNLTDEERLARLRELVERARARRLALPGFGAAAVGGPAEVAGPECDGKGRA